MGRRVRIFSLAIVAALAVAACAASNEPDAGQIVQLPPATTVSISSTTTSTMTSTMTSTTASTVAPTTTISPTELAVADVCESLRTEGFETRRVVLGAFPDAFATAGGVGDGRDEVAARCVDALDRLDGAVAIRDRLEAIDMVEEDGWFPMTLSDFTCDDTVFSLTATNDAAIPLGLHANFELFVGDDREDAVQSSAAPLVVWSIEPGASDVVSGTFAGFSDHSVLCGFRGQVFDADPSRADASIDGTTHPELTGDDPASWFPALSEVEHAARTSGDVDLAALTEDVRSIAYDEVALAILEGVTLPDHEIIEVCERGRSQPDPDHIGFVYLERLPNGTTDGRFAPGDTRLSHGLFRRGADGQWRWLSTARYFESTLTDDCRGVDPDLEDIMLNGL